MVRDQHVKAMHELTAEDIAAILADADTLHKAAEVIEAWKPGLVGAVATLTDVERQLREYAEAAL